MNVVDGVVPTLVIDNGSDTCKAGFAGEGYPRVTMPSIFGTPKCQEGRHGMVELRGSYVGQEAQKLRDILNLEHPIKCGIVDDWENMIHIWRHIFQHELRVDETVYPVLLTEPPLNPRYNRNKMTEIMFETFNLPALYISDQAVLALYSNGRSTGTVFDSGDGVTHAVPIYEGHSIKHGIKKSFSAGQSITNHLMTYLSQSGLDIAITDKKATARHIKETMCYVSLDFNKEMSNLSSLKKIYELPDGHIISVDKERLSPSAMFSGSGVTFQDMLYESIMKCDKDIRKDLFSNVFLSGGNTMFQGFAERMQKEIKAKVLPNTVNINITAPKERKYSVWIGGSVLASISSFQRIWISKQEYHESGPNIVNKKCF